MDTGIKGGIKKIQMARSTKSTTASLIWKRPEDYVKYFLQTLCTLFFNR